MVVVLRFLGRARPRQVGVLDRPDREFEPHRGGLVLATVLLWLAELETHPRSWPTPNHRGFDAFVCPGCQSAAEERRRVGDFLETVKGGKQVAEREGVEYPADLAATADALADQQAARDKQLDDLERRLADDGETSRGEEDR